MISFLLIFGATRADNHVRPSGVDLPSNKNTKRPKGRVQLGGDEKIETKIWQAASGGDSLGWWCWW